MSLFEFMAICMAIGGWIATCVICYCIGNVNGYVEGLNKKRP
jgi:hypothetical protein